ncbi:MAG TPA: amidohydrolase, partial [Gemmatimonadaceae bacterium]|nr:amidohydrolase [Gemmatimonadaceae bacterium]
MRLITVLFVLCVSPAALTAQNAKAELAAAIDARKAHYATIADEIWSLAEVGYQEHRSSARLQTELKGAGFTVESGVAGLPTAFVASYGSGKPVIGVLAEFDALPGLSQGAVPVRKPLVEHGAGHACGHHLFGTASAAAAIAVREWMAKSGQAGTLRVYGTPAEEGGGGKIYMVRAGLFDDVDVVLDWHPESRNDAGPGSSLANISGKFRFRGKAAHAAIAPWAGRSALDAVEAMNHMVNMMREHVPDGTRLHYIITSGGGAPNVVPDFAEAYYYARHPDSKVVFDLWARVELAAKGAAMGTETEVEVEVVNGVYALLPNETLARMVHANLHAVGGVHYTAEERAFAEQIAATLDGPTSDLAEAARVRPYGRSDAAGSTDVGDVSWVVPNAGFGTASWVPGTSAHSWQAVAAGGMSIGHKGMIVAAKTLAMSVYDLFTTPGLITEARAEFVRARGANFTYRPLIGDREPPLNYR